MNITDAIDMCAESFRYAGNLTPSHCDVRCYINDLLSDCDNGTQRRCDGYDQTRAWIHVRRLLGNPVSRKQAPYGSK